eukprot:CAMPEP_0198117668 /NCGR_PEP_ID=MMETSP1442-20131203/18861_1 /TAXON_ID= /ORGANISM="Craspedostauros australis, Strain CCMP3328" /LENGTH=104 /DNA_ID=CAMNT_0043775767 /DNA_START=264 /DNA_END=578 /DNA_ORIENTATION=+
MESIPGWFAVEAARLLVVAGGESRLDARAEIRFLVRSVVAEIGVRVEELCQVAILRHVLVLCSLRLGIVDAAGCAGCGDGGRRKHESIPLHDDNGDDGDVDGCL